MKYIDMSASEMNALVVLRAMNPQPPPEVDFVAIDNHDPPLWWGWCGEQDESAEAWCRVYPPHAIGDVLAVHRGHVRVVSCKPVRQDGAWCWSTRFEPCPTGVTA